MAVPGQGVQTRRDLARQNRLVHTAAPIGQRAACPVSQFDGIGMWQNPYSHCATVASSVPISAASVAALTPARPPHGRCQPFAAVLIKPRPRLRVARGQPSRYRIPGKP